MINLWKPFKPGQPLPAQQGVALSDGTLVMAQPQGRNAQPMKPGAGARKLRRQAQRLSR